MTSNQIKSIGFSKHFHKRLQTKITRSGLVGNLSRCNSENWIKEIYEIPQKKFEIIK